MSKRSNLVMYSEPNEKLIKDIRNLLEKKNKPKGLTLADSKLMNSIEKIIRKSSEKRVRFSLDE